nr:hypothetical protein BaRGS_034349 [Batillaria attramentaria]
MIWSLHDSTSVELNCRETTTTAMMMMMMMVMVMVMMINFIVFQSLSVAIVCMVNRTAIAASSDNHDATEGLNNTSLPDTECGAVEKSDNVTAGSHC